MQEVIYQADLDAVLILLKSWLSNQTNGESTDWLENKLTSILKKDLDSECFMTFSAISRYFNKDALQLTSHDLNKAISLRKNWRPARWSLSQLARAYFLLSLAHYQPDSFQSIINKLFSAADLEELIALYQTLPLFPYPEKFLLHATNGIRSNMLSVFEAIALNNPYPEDYFNRIAWNQLVLKAFFVDSPIQYIVGFKRRANPVLAEILLNTAKERAAAKRSIKPELWYLIGRSMDMKTLTLVEGALQDKNIVLQQGALLAFSQCSLPKAQKLFNNYAGLQKPAQETIYQLHSFDQNLI